jgi:hypothetical protein
MSKTSTSADRRQEPGCERPSSALDHNKLDPTKHRIRYLACGRCPHCIALRRRRDDLDSVMEFSTAHLTAEKRARLFASLKAGRVILAGETVPLPGGDAPAGAGPASAG